MTTVASEAKAIPSKVRVEHPWKLGFRSLESEIVEARELPVRGRSRGSSRGLSTGSARGASTRTGSGSPRGSTATAWCTPSRSRTAG